MNANNALRTAIAAGLLAAASSAAAEIRTETVRFESNGDTLVGTLYLPETRIGSTTRAAVVAGSLSSVKEQMGGTYARQLAERGIVAMAIDYANYGESEGAPRFTESPATKRENLRDAVRFLANVEGVDPRGVGLLGICTSGGNVLEAAAGDGDVAFVATVAGWFAEPSLTPALYGGDDAVAALRAAGREAASSDPSRTLAVYGLAGAQAAHVGDHLAYYFDRNRGAIPQWTNAMTVASWNDWLDFNPVAAAARVTAPTLMIHSDGSALPEQARKVHGLLAGPRTLAWMEGGHFDFYDRPETVSQAADEIASFISKL